MLRFSFVLSVLLAIGSAANAKVSTPLASAWLGEVPQDPASNICSTSFIEAYKKVIIEIRAIAVASKAGEKPTNLPQAVHACDVLEKSFAGVQCEIGTQTANVADLKPACGSVRDLANSMGVQPAPDALAPKAGEETDETLISTFAPNGLLVRINGSAGAADFQQAIDNPKARFFVDGQLLGLMDATMSPGKVRCVLAFPLSALQSVAKAGDQFRSGLIQEENRIDNFYLKISLDGVPWNIECAKQVDPAANPTGFTYGELKKAFGTAAEFSYAP